MSDRYLHPERMHPGDSLAYRRLKRMWKEAYSNLYLAEGEEPSYKQVLEAYLLEFTQIPLGTSRKLLGEYAVHLLFPALEGLLSRSSDPDSFLVTHGGVAGMELQQTLLRIMATGESPGGVEKLTSSVLAHYANLRWAAHNRPTYTVAGDLSDALQHTQLRNYPADLLTLPFPALYLELPPGVFHLVPTPENPLSEPAEGVYVLQENHLKNRTWRFVVTPPAGVGDITDLGVRDSSVWFFSMEFPENASVEECIRHTLDKITIPAYSEVQTIDGNKVEVMRGLNEEQIARFKRGKPHMLELFRYVMNVMIYVTSSEADITYWNASKEYRDLKARAMKAKGPKRDTLNQRLKQLPEQRRILLGRNLVIDRKNASNPESETGDSRTVKVRSYVPGYWNTYHVGKGRTQTISKLVKPHFRGPEEAPLTSPPRRVIQ